MRLATLVRWSARGVTGLLLAAVVVSGRVSAGGNANSEVFTPNAHPYGTSHARWSAEWMKWSYSLPVDGHPLFDAPGTDGSEGQAGRVWYLGGTFLSSETDPGQFVGTADRTVVVPKNTALFLPIVNASATDLEGTATRRRRSGPRRTCWRA